MTDRIQLYSLATPNGQKIGIALEEMNIPYDAHLINILKDDQFTDEFIAINPNSKIPAIVDPVGDNGKPLSIMESGAILVYLAEKSGMFLSKDPTIRCKTLQWLFFQMGGVGPMFGQFGHFFRYSKEKCDHPYPLERYSNETKRLLGVLEKQLNFHNYLVGNEISIADFATAPWVLCLEKFYQAGNHLQLSSFPKVMHWMQSVVDRPKASVGLKVCSLD